MPPTLSPAHTTATKHASLIFIRRHRCQVLLTFLQEEFLEASADHLLGLRRNNRQLVIKSLHVVVEVEGVLAAGHREQGAIDGDGRCGAPTRSTVAHRVEVALVCRLLLS